MAKKYMGLTEENHQAIGSDLKRCVKESRALEALLVSSYGPSSTEASKCARATIVIEELISKLNKEWVIMMYESGTPEKIPNSPYYDAGKPPQSGDE